MNISEANIIIARSRYDELLHKEALLENIETLHKRMSDYAFRDVIGHLLKTEKAVKSDENT